MNPRVCEHFILCTESLLPSVPQTLRLVPANHFAFNSGPVKKFFLAHELTINAISGQSGKIAQAALIDFFPSSTGLKSLLLLQHLNPYFVRYKNYCYTYAHVDTNTDHPATLSGSCLLLLCWLLLWTTSHLSSITGYFLCIMTRYSVSSPVSPIFFSK